MWMRTFRAKVNEVLLVFFIFFMWATHTPSDYFNVLKKWQKGEAGKYGVSSSVVCYGYSHGFLCPAHKYF